MKLAWIVLIFLYYTSILGWTWGDSLAGKNKEGARLYKEGKFNEALSKWRDAQIEHPDNDKLNYNIGNGLHEEGQYEDALKEYEKSLSSKVGAGLKPAPTKDNEFTANTYYNIGNTHYRMGKLQEAIEDYRKCLSINPKDEDAKYNIEFIKKKLKEKPQKQKEEQKQKESQQKENKESSGKQNQESQTQQQEQKSEENHVGEGFKPSPIDKGENKESRTQEEKQKSENQNAKEISSGEEKKDEMSKEDAIRLLDALKDDEKDLQKELRKQPIEGEYKVEKDW